SEDETLDGVSYSVASRREAAAGNRYEETVYAIRGTRPCVAVRTLIHYGVIENYPPETHAFDREALGATLDRMRKSLVLAP
ncbi:MAG: hypothetical protein KC729_21825, partial [Candidatus Eisenbacteria bacterium]|nr:hypothetical protein [Candidatus Eisenbacteria bacterium]